MSVSPGRFALDGGPRYAEPGLWARIARPVGFALSPLLIVQGKLVRRQRDRLPNAPEPWSGEIVGPRPLRVVGLGDSTVAGVGVALASEGLVAQVSREISQLTSRGVAYESYGQRGITSPTLLSDYIPQFVQAPPGADIVLVSIGANDAKSLVAPRKTRSALAATLDIVHDHSPDALIVVSSLPAFRYFFSLPQPLRSVLAGHAARLESTLRPMVESRPYAMMSKPPRRYPPEFFAPDGFHPGQVGYQLWARFAIDDARERGALGPLGAR